MLILSGKQCDRYPAALSLCVGRAGLFSTGPYLLYALTGPTKNPKSLTSIGEAPARFYYRRNVMTNVSGDAGTLDRIHHK